MLHRRLERPTSHIREPMGVYAVFWQAYFQANLTLYGRLEERLRPRLSDRMNGDLQTAIREGEFNLKYSDPLTREQLSLLLRSPREFDRHQKELLDSEERAWDEEQRRQDEIDDVDRRLCDPALRPSGEEKSMEQKEERKRAGILNQRWLMDEMGRDLAPLRMLIGFSTEEWGLFPDVLKAAMSVNRNAHGERV